MRVENQPARKRPFGVTIIIILQIISLVVLIANNTVLQVVDDVAGAGLAQLFRLNLRWFGYSSLAYMIGAAILFLAVAIIFGLWRLHRWAWFLVMIQLGGGMAFNLWLYFQGNSLYLTMLLSVAMVFYLNQREVQLAFAPKIKVQEETWTT